MLRHNGKQESCFDDGRWLGNDDGNSQARTRMEWDGAVPATYVSVSATMFLKLLRSKSRKGVNKAPVSHVFFSVYSFFFSSPISWHGRGGPGPFGLLLLLRLACKHFGWRNGDHYYSWIECLTFLHRM